MKRLPGWRGRLSAALLECDATPFSYENGGDCIMRLVAPAVQAMTGEDFAADYRGKYQDADGARAALAAKGFSSLSEALASVFPTIEPAHAQIGDIAIVETPGLGIGEAAGIVAGPTISMLAAKGRASVPLKRAAKAFRVPY